MKFLLDTNVFVHLGNQSRGWVGIAQRIRAVGIEQCAMSAMSAYELRYLLLRGPGRIKRENIERLSAAFASVRQVLPITGAVAEKAAILRVDLQAQGLDIGLPDCVIAAQALGAGLSCVTANRKHFDRINGLAVEDWSSAAYQPV